MMFTRTFLILATAAGFINIPLQTVQSQTIETPSLMLVNSPASERLNNLCEDFFSSLQQSIPELATFTGLQGSCNGLWTDHSEASYLSRMQMLERTLKALHGIDRQELSVSDQLNYDLLEKDLNESLEGYAFQSHYMPLDQLGGIPLEVESILGMMPTSTEDDYANILSRLSGIPQLIDQTLDLLKTGLEKGLTPPKVVLRKLPNLIAKMIPHSSEASIFFQPFRSFPESFKDGKREVLVQKALGLINEQVYPAYAKLHGYLETEYVPACRHTVATGDLPNGAELYQYCVRRHTTTDLSPFEIHKIGLEEVERIKGEMQNILDEIGFSGSMVEYFDYLNTSPEFFYTEPQSLISGYKDITNFIDGQLHLLFGRFPILPYEVVAVPEYAEEGQVGAYYMRGSLATGRPGRFYANTYDLGSRPKWQMETLALHEAVPGHHFQISIAQEIDGLPEFRKYNSYTAYIEGWGLYSESLGKELGLYKSHVNQFGRLIEEIWRASRLVVDTGIHALGWTREEAIRYMRENTGINEREVTTEIDRYIVWPGQALAYKIGELSIQRWRLEATQALGERFDIRSFHDMLLSQGALPLDICENQVNAWIQEQKH